MTDESGDDDDKAAYFTENETRILKQAIEINGALQIQAMHRAGNATSHLARQRRLADLSRTQDGYHWKLSEPVENRPHMFISRYHDTNPIVKSLRLALRFQCEGSKTPSAFQTGCLPYRCAKRALPPAPPRPLRESRLP